MTLLVTAAFTVALASTQATGDVVMAKEPSFQNSVSPSLKLVSVRNVLEQLTKDSGASVSVQPSVAELKVALLVKDRPSGWVLDRIADVLDLEWKKDRGIRYQLVQSAEAASAFSQTKKRFEDHRRATSRAWINQLATSSQSTRKELASQLEEVRKQAALEQYEKKPGWSDRFQKLVGQMSKLELGGQSVNYALGLVAQQHRLALEQTILTGQPFLAATQPVPGAQPLPSKFLSLATSRSGPEEPSLAVFAAAWGPFGLEYGIHTLYSSLTPARMSYFDMPPDMGVPPPKPVDRYLKWGASRSDISAQLAGKPISPLKASKTPGWETELEILLEAAECSNLDFVGDAFHTLWSPRSPVVKTASEFWSNRAGGVNGPWLKVEDGAILYRHGGPWLLREVEIPEPALNKLKAQLEKPAPQVLDACAEFAAPLSRLQTTMDRAISPIPDD